MKSKKIIAFFLSAVMLCGTAEALPKAPVTVAAAAAKLSAPKTVKVYPGSTTATIKWSAVKGADAYGVQMYDSAKGKYTEVKQVKGTSYRLTGLKVSTTYKIKIVTYDKVGGKLTAQGATAAKKVTTTKAPTSIKLSGAPDSIKVGETVTVKATVSPSKFKDVKWSISDSKVAKITATGTSVKIKGKKNGTATLTAKAGTVSCEYKITVGGDSGGDSGTVKIMWGEYSVKDTTELNINCITMYQLSEMSDNAKEFYRGIISGVAKLVNLKSFTLDYADGYEFIGEPFWELLETVCRLPKLEKISFTQGAPVNMDRTIELLKLAPNLRYVLFELKYQELDQDFADKIKAELPDCEIKFRNAGVKG